MTSPASGTTVSPETQGSTGATPVSGSPTGAQSTGFRYTAGDGVPDWAVGKTAQEMLELSKQMYGVISSGQQQQQPQLQQPQQQPQQYQPQQPSASPSNDDWLTNPADAFQRAMTGMQQSQFAPVIEQMVQANAANAKALAEQRYADDFRRYGPEIQMELSRVPANMQTFDNIKYVVDLVRGRHAKEINNETLERAIQERLASGTLRPGTADPGGVAATDPSGVDFTQLPEGYQAVLQRAGVKGLPDLDRFLTKYYGSDVNLADARKQWFEQAKQGTVVVESIKGAGYRREA